MRMNVYLHREDMNRLEELSQKQSKSSTIQKAIKLYHLLQGKDLIFIDKNGEKEKIIILD